jgi:hypothetical protein
MGRGSLLARFDLRRECAGDALAAGHELRLAEQVAHERAHEARADQLQPDRLDVDVGADAPPGLLRGQERRDRLDAAVRAQARDISVSPSASGRSTSFPNSVALISRTGSRPSSTTA